MTKIIHVREKIKNYTTILKTFMTFYSEKHIIVMMFKNEQKNLTLFSKSSNFFMFFKNQCNKYYNKYKNL